VRGLADAQAQPQLAVKDAAGKLLAEAEAFA
jgi:hypothetical protein